MPKIKNPPSYEFFVFRNKMIHSIDEQTILLRGESDSTFFTYQNCGEKHPTHTTLSDEDLESILFDLLHFYFIDDIITTIFEYYHNDDETLHSNLTNIPRLYVESDQYEVLLKDQPWVHHFYKNRVTRNIIESDVIVKNMFMSYSNFGAYERTCWTVTHKNKPSETYTLTNWGDTWLTVTSNQRLLGYYYSSNLRGFKECELACYLLEGKHLVMGGTNNYSDIIILFKLDEKE